MNGGVWSGVLCSSYALLVDTCRKTSLIHPVVAVVTGLASSTYVAATGLHECFGYLGSYTAL